MQPRTRYVLLDDPKESVHGIPIVVVTPRATCVRSARRHFVERLRCRPRLCACRELPRQDRIGTQSRVRTCPADNGRRGALAMVDAIQRPAADRAAGARSTE